MIHYILFNQDRTEVINTIYSEKELDIGIISSDLTKLVKLEPDTYWNQATHSIESSQHAMVLTSPQPIEITTTISNTDIV